MALVRWEDPIDMLNRFEREMSALINQFFGNAAARRTEPTLPRVWAPAVDVREDDNEITINMELPGVKPEEVEIELTGDMLCVKGERKFQDEERRKDYVRIERAYGTFQRSFTLGTPTDAEKVTAHYRDGVLSITLPKAEQVRPKKVQVKAG